jgi:hypothetical protein
MAEDVKSSRQFETGIPHTLFQTRMNVAVGPFGPPAWRYDASADGKRFLINSETAVVPSPASLTIVLNWQAPK